MLKAAPFLLAYFEFVPEGEDEEVLSELILAPQQFPMDRPIRRRSEIEW